MKIIYLICALILGVLFVSGIPSSVVAENKMIENFASKPDTRWQFITDTVMGGVSSGKVEFIREDGYAYARMTGNVSTENSGGFIQIRMKLTQSLPQDALGLRLLVRGNMQRYFLHLRTSGTVLPWQYYQAGFDVSEDWKEVLLPFEVFKASGIFLRANPLPESVKSVGIVAFGRDHKVGIEVRQLGYFSDS